jgi:hypothetical protein
MAIGFPVKADYATGDVLSAANMNDLSGTVNTLYSTQYAAGKNKIINGDFGIWQRGTSFAAQLYCADRWINGSDGTCTVTRETFTPATAPVAGYEGTFFLRQTRTATGSFQILSQRIEDVRIFAGQTITLSFWAKADADVTNIPSNSQNFGSGGSAQVTTIATGQTITTSWARYSYSIVVPSISGKTIGTGSNLEIRPIRIVDAVAHTVDIWGVQLEAGSVATAFQTATGTIQGELAACQRYYVRNTAGAAGQHFGNGNNQSTTVGVFIMEYPTQMRIAPTALEQSGTAGDYSIRHQATSTTASAVPAFESASLTKGIFTITVASGLTAGNGSFARPVNSTAYLGWSAEL